MMRRAYSVVCDLDGVLHRGSNAIPGCKRFVAELQRSGREYLFLTNSPDQTPRELHLSLRKLGMNVPQSQFYTSAQVIASFLRSHATKPSVYLIGSGALRQELKNIGARFTEKRPEYVIVASGGTYTLAQIDTAIELIMHGSKFVSASREMVGLTETGLKAGCGALIAPIENATHRLAYVVGKPNHLMIREAERKFGIDPLTSLMIGDNLETDIDVGIQAQMKTVLVLSGLTSRADLERSACQPDYVFESVAKLRLAGLP
jgi:NagD protein